MNSDSLEQEKLSLEVERLKADVAASPTEQQKRSLETRKLEQETASATHTREKLKLEIEQLKDQLSPKEKFLTRVWPMMTSVLTVVVSIIAISISVFTGEQQRRFQQQQAEQQQHFQERLRHDEALRKAVELATDASAFADRRIAGIWQLNGFWEAGADDQILASVLSAELTLGDERRFARCAAAEVIGNAITEGDFVDSSANPERAKSRARLLYGSSRGDVGLVIQQHLLLRQNIPGGGDPRSPFDKLDPNPSNTCNTVLDATREAIRKNWEYLRDVNLNSTDLGKIQLYKADLAGAMIRSASLRGANLRCSNLFDVDMTGSDWTGGDFRYANVTKARPAEFTTFAKQQGAFDSMEDSTWLKWRKAGFPLDGKEQYTLASGSAARCGEKGSF